MGMTLNEDHEYRPVRQHPLVYPITETWMRTGAAVDLYIEPREPVSGPVPLGVEGAYMAAMHPKTGSTDGPAWTPVERGQVITDDDAERMVTPSDFANLDSEITSKSVEPLAWLISAGILTVIAWVCYAVGKALGWWS